MNKNIRDKRDGIPFKNVLGSAPLGMVIINSRGKICCVNSRAERMFGYDHNELTGRGIDILIPERFRADHSVHQANFFREDTSRAMGAGRDLYAVKKDGTEFMAEIGLSPLKLEDGQGVLASIIDITKRKQAEEESKRLSDQLKTEKTKLERVLSIEQGLNSTVQLDKLIDFAVEKTMEIMEAERCSLMFLDQSTGELDVMGSVGMDQKFVRKKHVKTKNSVVGYVIQKKEPVLVTDIDADSRFSRKNRISYRSKSFMSAPIRSGDNILGILNVADRNSRDTDVFSVADLKVLNMIVSQLAVAIRNAKHYQELDLLAGTDPLTSLYNFRHFKKSLDLEVERSRRFAGELCLLLVDVDEFKSYNDAFGHLAGDELLKDIGKTLHESIRKIDIVCRYAGDEFVVILPGTNVSQARIVAEKIRNKTEKLSLKRKVAISIGVAPCSKDMSPNDLVQKADKALYKAKKAGKNRLCVDDR